MKYFGEISILLSLLAFVGGCNSKSDSTAEQIRAEAKARNVAKEAAEELVEAEQEAEETALKAEAKPPATTYYGLPEVRGQRSVLAQGRPKDGSPREKVEAAKDQYWVVVTFPETEGWESKPDNIQKSYFQLVMEDGEKTWPIGLTTDLANNAEHRKAGDDLHFSLYMAKADFTPGEGYPYGAVFEVSTTSASALLRVSDKTVEVQW